MPYAQNLHAIQPNYFETAEKAFLVHHDFVPDDPRATDFERILGHPNKSGLPLGDQLYTPRGSQGSGSMLYFLRRYGIVNELGSEHIDNDERGIILYRLKL